MTKNDIVNAIKRMPEHLLRKPTFGKHESGINTAFGMSRQNRLNPIDILTKLLMKDIIAEL
jgi:hypothetical protein